MTAPIADKTVAIATKKTGSFFKRHFTFPGTQKNTQLDADTVTIQKAATNTSTHSQNTQTKKRFLSSILTKRHTEPPPQSTPPIEAKPIEPQPAAEDAVDAEQLQAYLRKQADLLSGADLIAKERPGEFTTAADDKIYTTLNPIVNVFKQSNEDPAARPLRKAPTLISSTLEGAEKEFSQNEQEAIELAVKARKIAQKAIEKRQQTEAAVVSRWKKSSIAHKLHKAATKAQQNKRGETAVVTPTEALPSISETAGA